ncbi:hypothetical protein OK016_09735 [Vibrio chagasii]|nr:hypothetical protein [Vibrio chagasii]
MISAAAAAEIIGVNIEDVTSEQRRRASKRLTSVYLRHECLWRLTARYSW